MRIWVQKSASMQKRTSPLKFAHLSEKSENGSISNFSTKVGTGHLRRSNGCGLIPSHQGNRSNPQRSDIHAGMLLWCVWILLSEWIRIQNQSAWYYTTSGTLFRIILFSDITFSINCTLQCFQIPRSKVSVFSLPDTSMRSDFRFFFGDGMWMVCGYWELIASNRSG